MHRVVVHEECVLQAVSKLALDALDQPRRECCAKRVIHEVDDALTGRHWRRRVTNLDFDARSVGEARGQDRRVAPGDGRKVGRDLDPDESMEGKLRRHCQRPSFSAADVDKRVLLAVGQLRKTHAHDARLRSAVTGDLGRHRRVAGALHSGDVAAGVEAVGDVERVMAFPPVIDPAHEPHALENRLDARSP